MKTTSYVVAGLSAFAAWLPMNTGASPYINDLFTEPLYASPWVVAQSSIPIRTPAPSLGASCVLYAKWATGYKPVVGSAQHWPINNKVPAIEAVVIFRYPHVAVIT